MSRNAGSIPTPAAPDPDDEYDDDEDDETPGLAAAPLLPGRPHTGGMSESFTSEPSATASYSSYLIFYERMGVVGGMRGGEGERGRASMTRTREQAWEGQS